MDLAMYFGPPGSAERISKGKLEEMPPPTSTSPAFPFLPCFKERGQSVSVGQTELPLDNGPWRNRPGPGALSLALCPTWCLPRDSALL